MLRNSDTLQRKHIAVPSAYVKQSDGEVYVSSAIDALWHQAKVDLEGAGATVEIVEDFPVMQAYTKLPSTAVDNDYASFGLPKDWNITERGKLIAHAWEDFLQNNKNPNFPSIKGIDPRKIFPHLSPDDPQVKFTEPANAVHWSRLASYVENRE